MGKPDKYTIDLKGLSEDYLEQTFQLDESFFSELDTEDIQKGNLQCKLEVRQTSGGFEFTFHTEGVALATCDRCLGDLEVEVDAEDKLTVKFGAENSDEGDGLVVVSEEEGFLDVAWYIYEFMILSLPLQCVHKEGECDEVMISELNKHAVVGDLDDAGSTVQKDAQETDPRWNELKKIIDNN